VPTLNVAPHVIVGSLVLVFFWRTILAVKGGAVHRRNGRRYLLFLLPLLLSVVPISLTYVNGDPARLVQLVYLSLVVAAAGWTAWRAVRDRDDPARFRGPVFRAIAVALTAAALALFAIGIVERSVLSLGFAIMGIVYGGAMIGHLGRPPAQDWWLSWHLNGVSLLFAATHASFLGLTLRTLFPEQAGETMHAFSQLGTIAFAWGLRQWLGWRYAHLAGGAPVGPARPAAA